MSHERLKLWGAGIGIIAISLLGYVSLRSRYNTECDKPVIFKGSVAICVEDTHFIVYGQDGEENDVQGIFYFAIYGGDVLYTVHEPSADYLVAYDPKTKESELVSIYFNPTP